MCFQLRNVIQNMVIFEGISISAAQVAKYKISVFENE